VKEKPILFNSEMVRAILDGRKAQTRRVIKPQPQPYLLGDVRQPAWFWSSTNWSAGMSYADMAAAEICRIAWTEAPLTPYDQHPLTRYAPYHVGDRLWVRESIRVDKDCSAILYVADQARVFRGKHFVGYAYYPQDWPWKHSVLSSRFMPKWATRIWLEVTGVRAEQVQDIIHNDILAEGWNCRDDLPWAEGPTDALRWFITLWDSINAKRGFGWDTNSWVWVYEFKRMETPGGAKQ